jgi:hypothetical protein
MQSNHNLQIQIVPDDFPAIKEVDLKLLELAKKWDAKVVTNDFNLNKVAQLHRVEVLNVNDLANALKPVVLPGEKMNILILKEGKEFNQGVGYLDDGTMVVVDHARRLIGRSIEITVTSVLQTASGKMIFGRLEDPTRPEQPRQELSRPDLSRQDMPRPDMSRPDMSRPDLTRPDLSRQDMSRPDPTTRPDNPRAESTRAAVSVEFSH